MTDALPVYIWPFIAAVLSYILCLYVISKRRLDLGFDKSRFLSGILKRLNGDRKEKELTLLLILIALIMAGQEILFLVIQFIVKQFANTFLITELPVDPVIYAVFSFAYDACFVCLLLIRDSRAAKGMRKLLAVIPVLLLTETLLLNAGSFSAKQMYQTVNMPSSTCELGENLTIPYFSDDGILLEGDAALIFGGLPDYTRVINVEFDRGDVMNPLGLVVQVAMKDDNTGAVFGIADMEPASGYRDVQLSVRPYGSLNQIELYVSRVTDPVTITKITAFNANPYRADAVRFVLGLALFAAGILIFEFKLWRVWFDVRKKSHVAALALCVCLTVGSTFLLYKTDEFDLYDYPFADNTVVDDIFALKFDAMYKGLPYLDLPSEEGLESLNNIYDFTERTQAGVDYRWDFAYHDGHYYCYFGATPVLLFYYPLHLVTGKVPSYNLALGLAGTLAAAGIVLGYLAVARTYAPRKKLLPYLLSVPVVCVSSMMFYSLAYPMKYYLPSLCALAGLGFAIFFGFSGVSEKKDWKAAALFALSGVSLALCAGARPVTAMGAAVLLPAFIRVLADRKLTIGGKLTKAAAFAVPVMTGIILILSYNNFRFGNPFDFGEKYQLTVSNISSLSTNITLLPVALFYFFLQPYVFTGTFPYFGMTGVQINNYEIFRNIELNVGVLNIPFFLVGMLLVWGTLARVRKGVPSGKERIEYNAYALITLAMSVIIAWFDFSRGGTAVRYTADFAAILAMMAGVVLLRRLMVPSGRKELYGLIMAALIFTPVLIFLSYLPLYNSNIQFLYPELLERTEDLFLFWR